MTGFSFNKAIGGGVSAGLLSTFLPALLGVLHVIQPAAAAVNPFLGVFVGVGAFILTWLTPKNAAPKPAS
jgi:hypothetical protein